MRAGRLKHKITIQAPGTTQDAIGQPIPGWTDFASVRADIFDISGREYVAAAAVQNAAQTKMMIRYLAGIVPDMRVLDGTVAYNIEAVLGQDRVSLLLMCKRVTQ
jgi:SPP1 family predicted phage head-tail adaptor